MHSRADSTAGKVLVLGVIVLLLLALVVGMVGAGKATTASAQEYDGRKEDRDRDRDRDRNKAAAPAFEASQESEQETESGDVDQSFTVTSEGDNSSQCANTQGVANTGNAQNQIDLIQGFSEADDFEFDEVGSTLTVNPNEDVDDVYSCTTQVNQAASASG